MKLKTRLFLFVACVFLVMQTVSMISSYIGVNIHVEKVKKEIEVEMLDFNRKQVNDYREFITIALAEVELRLNTLFHKITDYSWLKKRYEPTRFNYETNQWSNSVMLVAANQWLDIVQTTVRGKLTSLILMRPPFLHSMYTVPVDDVVTLVVGVYSDNSVGVFIGAQYWSKELGRKFEAGLHDILFSLDTSRTNWLFFTLEQILEMNSETLQAKDIQVPHDTQESTTEMTKREVYQQLINATIENILAVRSRLLEKPDLVEKIKSKAWLEKNVLNQVKDNKKNFPRGIDTCQSHVCKQLKENSRSVSWESLHDWRERDDQNRLIWELGTITGTGIWHFDPMNKFAPKGIASFQNEVPGGFDDGSPYKGYGVFSSHIFRDTKIDLVAECSPPIRKGNVTTCMSDDFELIRSPENPNAVFIVNTLLYENDEDQNNPSTGSLTAGVNISPILEQLSLISPDRVLLLTKKGHPLLFDTHGNPISLTSKEEDILSALQGQTEGVVVDTNQKHYFFLHVTKITEIDGYIFVLQDKDSLYKRIQDLEKHAHSLLMGIAVQLIIVGMIVFIFVLLLINYFVQRMLRPIQDLASATKFVAAGELDDISFSAKDKARKDEVGTLVNSFEDMIEKMKEGNQVRAILHKVVNADVAEKIIKDGVELGGEVRQVAILFSDVRDFTHIAESMPPQDVLAMLNDCLTVLSEVIDEHKGVIDKYVGDEIMALFGAPVETENTALQSVLCAVKMMQVLVEWNRHRVTIGYCELKIGIGIHIGEVIAGNMGAQNHLNYTILGHNVNLTARLCDHAGEMEILITEDTLNAPGVKDAIEIESLPAATFKGITDPVTIFRVKY